MRLILPLWLCLLFLCATDANAQSTCADLFRKRNQISNPNPPSTIPTVTKLFDVNSGAKYFTSKDMRWMIVTERHWDMGHFALSHETGEKPPAFWVLIDLSTGHRKYLDKIEAPDLDWSGIPLHTENKVVFGENGFFVFADSALYEASYVFDYNGKLLRPPRIVRREQTEDGRIIGPESGTISIDSLQHRVTYQKDKDTPIAISLPTGKVIGALPSQNSSPTRLGWQPMGSQGYIAIHENWGGIFLSRGLEDPEVISISLSQLPIASGGMILSATRIDYVSPSGDYALFSGVRRTGVTNGTLGKVYDEWLVSVHINGTVKVLKQKIKPGDLYDGHTSNMDHLKQVREIEGTGKVVMLKSGKEAKSFLNWELVEKSQIEIVDPSSGAVVKTKLEGYWNILDTRYGEIALIRPLEIEGQPGTKELRILDLNGKTIFTKFLAEQDWLFTGDNRYVRLSKDQFLISGAHSSRLAIVNSSTGETTYRQGKIAALSHAFQRMVVYETDGRYPAYVVYDFHFKQQTILSETTEYHIRAGGVYGFLSANSIYVRQKQLDGPDWTLFLLRW